MKSKNLFRNNENVIARLVVWLLLFGGIWLVGKRETQAFCFASNCSTSGRVAAGYSHGTSPAATSSPQLSIILPRGVQRGKQHVLVFRGARLQDAQEVFLYDTGIKVDKIEQVDAQQVKVTVTVDSNCRIGEHVAQLRTTSGISEFRSFFVGALPEVKEVEPNNSFDQPQKTKLNSTVSGIVRPEDVDYFEIEAKKGQRLSVEIEGIRLAGPFWDPFIAILDINRFELASSDDTPLLRQDGFVSIVVPEDGTYQILVQDASYQGNEGARYRLHIGNFPRPKIAFPAGGRPGSEMELDFLGDPTGLLTKKVSVPKSDSLRPGIVYSDSSGVAPSLVPFRIVDLKNYLESEPNNARNAPNQVAFPCAFNGIIQKPGDRDYFKLAGKEGQTWDIECFARRLRSGLDPVINIYNSKGQRLAGDDDAKRPDCYLRFTVPLDDEYIILVRDHLGRGQDDFVYRVEINSPKPRLTSGIPRIDRYSQTRQTIVVPQGGTYATMVSAVRENFGGPVTVAENKLPEGVSIESPNMAPNLNRVPVLFKAAEDAPIDGQLVDFQIRHADQKRAINGGFSNLGDMVLGPPNNSLYVGCRINKLAVAVVKRLPFRIELIQPKVPIVRNGQMRLKVRVDRDEGFKQPIVLQFPFRPPGIGTRNTLVVPADKNEAYYPINANGSAQIGKWPVYVLAQASVNGPAYVSSELIELEITPPVVTVQMTRSSVEIGKTTEIFCKVTRTRDFDGMATARLYGLPAGVSVEPVEFDKKTNEFSFQVQTKDSSPAGKHKGIFCRVIVTEHGEPIQSTAGYVELQINKPLAKKTKAAPKKTPVKSAKQKPKPLSRLEQLRQQKSSQKKDIKK